MNKPRTTAKTKEEAMTKARLALPMSDREISLAEGLTLPQLRYTMKKAMAKFRYAAREIGMVEFIN